MEVHTTIHQKMNAVVTAMIGVIRMVKSKNLNWICKECVMNRIYIGCASVLEF
ncbi:unknown protein [Microcystis aeruginosa NIES-843]|uniref:Uncharacterized protein n=1 Tax=Microcystis aeruginosa (strain NIES-843 / IAM M-2473) TaxID=449447 RepID=B0JVT9_MICAN|nr:unknown protein [Microcystis aeruginosa NIES-843]